MELWYTEEHTDNVKFSLRVRKHLFAGESEFQKLDILDTYEYGTLMTLDGLVMVTDKDEFVYHDMIVHVPMAVNPDAKKVLVIGGGDGGTVRELMRYKGIEHVDMVEIDKLVCDAAREYFPKVSCELDNERVNLLYEDGVKFVEDSKDNTYDLIIIDSTDPIGPGEGLFTTSFYTNCHRILKDDGILVNQNESMFYQPNIEAAIKANSKLRKIFPIVKVYQASIPTYPSGYWMFGFASKKFDPIADIKVSEWENLGLKTKYYNTDLHVGSFALPNFVKEHFENGAI